ncbi:MAG TPA: hypothetical protein VH593_25155 [Ktedonobacteraceae bacterium]|jgi:hypothetical protein
MTHNTSLNDREQLNYAFAALAQKGYYAKPHFQCCTSCALAAIPDEYSKKFVYWHFQDDDSAFFGSWIAQPLYLGWDGDAKEIITTLHEFGFTVEFDGPDLDHIDTSAKLRVMPGRVA